MPFGDINVPGLQLFPIPVPEGGTGNSNFPINALIVGNSTAPMLSIIPGSNGQVLLGSTGGIPAFASLTSNDASITFTPGPNTLDLSASGGGGTGITWNEVTGTSQAAAVNNGYIANNASLVTITLPDTAAVGSIVRIAGKGAGGWRLAQNASESINFGSSVTTTGAGGYLEFTNQYDAVEVLCIVADTTWVVLSSVGNLTVV